MIPKCPKCQTPHDCSKLGCLKTPFRPGYHVCYSCSTLMDILPDGSTKVWTPK